MCKAVCLNIFLHLEGLVCSDLRTTKLKEKKKKKPGEKQRMSVWLYSKTLT